MQRLENSIIEENKSDSAQGITTQVINKNWDKIAKIIESIPTYEELIEKYKTLGVKSTLADINVPMEKLPVLLEYSPLVRNRVTLMRLIRMVR